MEHQLLQISNRKIDHLRQLFGVFCGEMIQLNQEDYHLFHLFISLHRKPSCQTLSNAFDKSKKTPRTFNDGLASNALKIL